jgi:phage FluMu protein Com
MWKVKTKTIPIKTEATGTISKSCRRYLKNIPGK